MSESQYKIISIGTVAENKMRGTDQVEIWLKEFNPFINGELKSDLLTVEVSYQDASGIQHSVSVKTSNTVLASWKGSGGNRISSPDVRRGDKVNIYRFGNTDKYYWELEQNGTSQRRLETIINTVSGTADEEAGAIPNEENSYTSAVSTHDGYWRISTSKANGEPAAYIAEINTKEGEAHLVDDMGNQAIMNSKDARFEFINAEGFFIKLIKGKLHIKCKEYLLETESYAANATGSYKVSTPLAEYTSMLQTGGDVTCGGGVTVTGAGNFQGASNFTSSITHNGTNIGATHWHQGAHGPTSGVQG